MAVVDDGRRSDVDSLGSWTWVECEVGVCVQKKDLESKEGPGRTDDKGVGGTGLYPPHRDVDSRVVARTSCYYWNTVCLVCVQLRRPDSLELRST